MQRIAYVALFGAFFIGACSTGGSFEVEVLSSGSAAAGQSSSAQYVVVGGSGGGSTGVGSVPSSDEVGFVISNVLAKNLASDVSQMQSIFTLNAGAFVKETAENKDRISIKFPIYHNGAYDLEKRDISLRIENGEWEYLKEQNLSTAEYDGVYFEGTQYNQLFLSLSNRTSSPYKNTMLGYAIIVDKEAQAKDQSIFSILGNPFYVASIFYKGFEQTKDMPLLGTFEYKGHWLNLQQLNASDDLFDMVLHRKLHTEFDQITLTADFYNKKLTGKLGHTNDGSDINYTIDADIRGNQFEGVATGALAQTGQAVNGSSHADAQVFGGFYGAGARELAGRAIATDNSWAGVFAAVKEDKNLSDSKAAGVLHFSNEKLTAFRGIDFSSLDVLVIDGERIVLNGSNSCCDMLQFVRIGQYQYQKNGATEGGYFVQGVPTPEQEMPTVGSTRYSGHWYGYARDENLGTASAHGLEAQFVADWGNKSVNGALYTANQVAGRSDAAIEIAADIKGNRFTGSADVKHWAVDTNQSNLSNTAAIRGKASVDGYFYGEKANELAGHFVSEDMAIGGVFAAKEVK